VSGADPYLYPNSNVLINRLGIGDAVRLEALEREFVTQRAAEGLPGGDFDLIHLRAIHKHLFQDIYDWAGEIRTVEIAKDGHAFQFRKFIETGMAGVQRRLGRTGFLEGLNGAKFAEDELRGRNTQLHRERYHTA
jgi:cell filamentation protein